MKNDWRLTNQKNYLYRAILKKVSFKETATNDHEHCEFCWKKFGISNDWLTSGYCTTDRYHWICNGCFQDFQKEFEWQVVED